MYRVMSPPVRRACRASSRGGRHGRTWTVESPQRLTLDAPVVRLDVRLISGRLNVVGTDGPARVDVTRDRPPAGHVDHTDGVLRVRHERRRGWPGVLWWLRCSTAGSGSTSPSPSRRRPRRPARWSRARWSPPALRRQPPSTSTAGQITLMGLAGAPPRRSSPAPSRRSASAATSPGDGLRRDHPRRQRRRPGARHRPSPGAITCDLDNPPAQRDPARPPSPGRSPSGSARTATSPSTWTPPPAGSPAPFPPGRRRRSDVRPGCIGQRRACSAPGER